MEYRVDPTPLSLRPLRRQIDAALHPVLSKAALSDVQLVVSELCTNAINAASEIPAAVVVRIDVLTPQSAIVEVEDAGKGFGSDVSPAHDSDETGRGLRIVRAVADELTVSRSPQQATTVRALLSWNEALELTGDLK